MTISIAQIHAVLHGENEVPAVLISSVPAGDRHIKEPRTNRLPKVIACGAIYLANKNLRLKYLHLEMGSSSQRVVDINLQKSKMSQVGGYACIYSPLGAYDYK